MKSPHFCHCHRPTVAFASALLLTLAISACVETKTGSTGTGRTDVPPIGATAAGPLSDLGPAGIANVGFADSSAQFIFNADGAKPITELRLGMTTELTGTIVETAQTGSANNGSIQSNAIGPVLAVDAATRRITLPGVVAQLDQNTIIDGVLPLTQLAVGTRVEVHGLPMPQPGLVLATRLSAKSAVDNTQVEVVGTVANLSATQFSIGTVTVVNAVGTSLLPGIGTSNPPAPLASNTRVRVIGSLSAQTNAVTPTRILSVPPVQRPDTNVHILDGIVESVQSAGRFRINDTDVQSNAAVAAQIVAGSRVRVRGVKNLGVVNATDTQLIGPNDKLVYRIEGDITDFVSINNFRLRGELIDANTAVFAGGNASQLRNGVRIRITGVAGLNGLVAQTVNF